MKRIFIQRSGWSQHACGLIGMALSFGRSIPVVKDDTGALTSAAGCVLVLGLPFYAVRVLVWGKVNDENA